MVYIKHEYFLHKSFKIVYADCNDHLVSEVIDFHKVDWKPYSKESKSLSPSMENQLLLMHTESHQSILFIRWSIQSKGMLSMPL